MAKILTLRPRSAYTWRDLALIGWALLAIARCLLINGPDDWWNIAATLAAGAFFGLLVATPCEEA